MLCLYSVFAPYGLAPLAPPLGVRVLESLYVVPSVGTPSRCYARCVVARVCVDLCMRAGWARTFIYVVR